MPSPGQMALMIPILAICFGLVIPLVAMLIKHQQRMAELIHGSRAEEGELNAMRSEIALLREQVSSLTFRMESLSEKVNALPATDLATRLEARSSEVKS